MTDTQSLISKVSLKIEGDHASEEFMRALLEVTVESSLHMADVATVMLHDPKLEWIDSDKLAPGRALQISMKAASERSEFHVVFDGEFVEMEPIFENGSHHLLVRAFDRLHRLGRGRFVRTFKDVTASDVVKKIAGEVQLQADVEATKEVHPYLLQRNQTNLEFLSERASAVGYLLYVKEKKLYFKRPEPPREAIELEWGGNLGEFRPRLTTIGQLNTVVARGWDVEGKKEIVSEVGQGEGLRDVGQKKEGGAFAKDAFRIQASEVVFDEPIRTPKAADVSARRSADRHEERFIQAEGSCAGEPRIVAGTSVKVAGVGDQFSGTYFVTSVSHRYVATEFTTHFSISGQTPATLLQLLRPERHSQVPGAGLVVGIVTDNSDEKGWGRVKVKYPWLSAEHSSDWARVVVVGAGDQRGIEFLPEVDDEVLVGFEMGDMRFPYVLGGLWNGKDSPPESNAQITQGGKVIRRVIRSRTGHKVVLDDSDGSSGITLEDKNGNRIQVESASNNLTIEAKGNITISATQQVVIKGMVIKLN